MVLGQKLAAQSVPVLGAVAGAATNYAYTSYYQEMAHVHFRLRRLAIEARALGDAAPGGCVGRGWRCRGAPTTCVPWHPRVLA